MKFFHTFGGKVLAFIACMLCGVIALGAGAGAGIMLSEDFYTRSEREIYDDVIRSNLISDGYRVIREAWDSGFCPVLLADRGNLSFAVLGKNDALVAISRRAQGEYDPERYYYRLNYYVKKNTEAIEFVDDRFLSVVKTDPELAEYDRDYVNYKVCFNLQSPFSAEDFYARMAGWVHFAYFMRYWVFAVALVFLILAIVFFVVLMRAAGRRPGDGALRPGPLDRVPIDLLLALYFAVCGASLGPIWDEGLAIVLFAPLLAALTLGLCMSLAGRFKRGVLMKNTVIYRILHGLWRLIRMVPLVWRACLIFASLCALELIGILMCEWDIEQLMLLWFLEKLLLTPLVIYFALGLRRLQAGGKALASGDLSHQTDTKNLIWAMKTHGEHLNSIAMGMNRAVEERLKSERMKTELITNVSHDLKTPLTSILNYSGLIAAEPCENEKITGYAQVLTRQSERLTRLIDDLVEASKASTGNLEVLLAPVEAQVLVQQVAGEYAERLNAAGLSLVTKQPDTPIRIMADGRRMWRVFDNLMNNVLKYAQQGTRVYLTLEKMADSAVIAFKNTSAQPLDISEEELLERFVRGDSARSTEGNGLGLSIARSLAELQGGILRLHIDGDLFKAILVFPVCA